MKTESSGVHFKLSDDENKALGIIAKKSGCSKIGFLREVLKDRIHFNMIKNSIPYSQALKKYIQEEGK